MRRECLFATRSECKNLHEKSSRIRRWADFEAAWLKTPIYA